LYIQVGDYYQSNGETAAHLKTF